MYRNTFYSAAGALALMLFAGCRTVTPAPVADANAEGIQENIYYYGDIELFDESSTPIAAAITTTDADGENAFAAALTSALQYSGVTCVTPDKPCDIRINIKSDYNELIPAPQCRMNHILTIFATYADGRKLLPPWEHKTEHQQPYPTAAEAKAKMVPQICRSIKSWGERNFNSPAEMFLQASVVRFKLSRKLIELNPIRFEEELRSVTAQLRNIRGVVFVRMIEADKANRIASFRILHRGKISFKNQFRKQK